jgi:lipoprotein-releasing system permease protein
MLLLVLAVAAGTGFQVPNAANMLGYKAELLEEGVTQWLGDIRVRPLDGTTFEDGDALVERIAKYPSVRAVVPALTLPAAAGKDGRFSGAVVTGLPGDMATKPYRIIDGAPLARGDDKGIVLGSSVARRIGAKTGDTLKLRVVLSAGPSPFPEERVGRYEMVVRGIAGGAMGAHEAMFVDRAFLVEEAAAPHAASIIIVHLDDHDRAQSVAAAMAPDLPNAQARAWVDDSAYLKNAVSANEAVGKVSQAMVIVAVTIPVLALLYISVLHRRREVGVLTALGFEPREIFVSFLLQALIVGVIGVLVGCAAGYGLVRYFQANPIFDWEGFVIRPVLSVECFLRPSLVVLLATLAAGVYPAWRAARVDPASVLRSIE